MQHWYVYYKLPRAQLSSVAARVDAMFNVIAATTSVRGRLLKRDDGDAQHVTLMEQYDDIADPATFTAAHANAVRGSGLSSELIAQRHVERFEDL
jgi:hypothetical protein